MSQVDQRLLERLVLALEGIQKTLDALCPIPTLPQPPEKPWGADHISYIDEEKEWTLEQEELRLKTLGRKVSESDLEN